MGERKTDPKFRPPHVLTAFGQGRGPPCPKVFEKKAKLQWDQEKPKLEAARRLRNNNNNNTPTDDQDFDDFIRNARRKFEFNMEPALPCIPILASDTAKARSVLTKCGGR